METKRKTILVVDEAPAFTQRLAQILEGEGYQVFEAEDGQSALRIRDEQEAIDLVVTEIRLPNKMGGFALVRELKARSTEQRILFMSASPVTNLDLLGGSQLLKKPFSNQELRNKVREALTTPAPTPSTQEER